jgi:replication factor C subunit 3/5
MFFIDKYKPKNIKQAYFHKDIINKLKNMSEDDSIPHIIFYGPEGSGKNTIISMFLEMVYDKYVHTLSDAIYAVTGSGNTVTQVTIKQSNYHIVIEPNNNNFDRYLIQDIVKEYAQRAPLDIFTKKKHFNTVLINNIDNLSYYAQTSLRRTMEIYSSTCRFIMWCSSLSKVIEPLRSRCYCFRVPAPTDDDMFGYLLEITQKENIQLDLKQRNNIIKLAQGNIKTVLWLLELTKLKENFATTYDEVIEEITKLILTTNMIQIITIRDLLYKIMITNITGSQIIKDIVKALLNNPSISVDNKIDIVQLSAKYEHNLIRGRRQIIHLEAFITHTIAALKNKKKLINNTNNSTAITKAN